MEAEIVKKVEVVVVVVIVVRTVVAVAVGGGSSSSILVFGSDRRGCNGKGSGSGKKTEQRARLQ